MLLEAEFRRLIREEVVRAVREATQHDQQNAVAAAPDELVSITAAAAIGGYSPATIRKWLKAGQLRRFGQGRSTRVSRGELYSFLKRLASNPTIGPSTEVDIEDRAISLVRGGK